MKDDFKYSRRLKTISRSIIILLSITLIIGLNFIAANLYFRGDLTENRSHSLSPESLAYLKKLDKPVTIIITIPPESTQKETTEIYRMVSHLVNEYAYATRLNTKGKITIEYVNPFRETLRAHEIATKYGVQKENAIIVTSGDFHKHIAGSDLYSFKHGEIEGFRGEQVFSSAILDVTKGKREKVYFIQGHGEMRTNDVDPLRGISQATHILQNQNLQIENLELHKHKEIPEDASLIVLASPQTPLLKIDIEKLRRYLNEKNGKLIIFLDPNIDHGLEKLLSDWGILADDMVVLDNGSDFQATGGDLIVRKFREHPITQFLIDYQLSVIVGLCRPIRPDLGASLDQRRTTVPLMASSESSWGERSYKNIYASVNIDPSKGLPGPIPIATLSERVINSQLGINIPGGRVIVFGNSDFISNNRINALGNKILFQNTINWSLEGNDLLNISPKKLKKYQLTLSRDNLIHIGVAMLAFPGALSCLGLLIYTVRRR